MWPRSHGSSTRRSARKAFSAPTTGGSALVVGDVVVPKIGNVKVLADAAAESKVLGTLAKTDELVIIGPVKNGFLKVQGASVTGWVSEVLVTKR